MTVKYNSSHIELLPNDVCLTNLAEKFLTYLGLLWISHESQMNLSNSRIELPFITATRPEYVTDS
jgi:hypothetical protein